MELRKDASSDLADTIQLLSDVTNQPAKLKMSPERFDGKLQDELPFCASLDLGDEYHMKFWEVLKSSGSIWYAEDCGYELTDRLADIITRSSYGSSKGFCMEEIIEDPKVIDRGRSDFLLSSLGGMNVEDPIFMDYEHHTLESLNEEDSYFKSIYLALMCSLKEKGIELPPILSKNEDIRKVMHTGDIRTLDDILSRELLEINHNYASGMFKHTEFEAEQIRKHVQKRNMYHDKSIPLVEKMSDWETQTVPGNDLRKYNVLVVEDFKFFGSETLGKLSEKVVGGLETLGKYGGTNIFPAFNLPNCMEICGTGQIDAIIMDGGHFSLGEAQKAIQIIGGETQLEQNSDETGIPNWDGAGEKRFWKEKIFETVERNGHETPSCLIVPEDIMNMDVGKFVAEMLH